MYMKDCKMNFGITAEQNKSHTQTDKQRMKILTNVIH